MFLPTKYVLKRTAVVTLIAALISISVSTGIRYIVGVQSDQITVIIRLVLPFIIAIPICLVWFSKLEKLDVSYRSLLKRANLLARHASTDPLTGLLNRRSFTEQIELALQHGVKGMFLIADVDYLKMINDKYGHITGDEAIIAIAHAFQQTLSDDSLIARIGGDEFCAFIPIEGSHNIDGKLITINEIAQREFRNRTGKQEMALSVSCGYIICKQNQLFKGLLQQADLQLYQRKNLRKTAV